MKRLVLLLFCSFSISAHAAEPPRIIFKGAGLPGAPAATPPDASGAPAPAARLVIPPEKQLMLEASKKVAAGDWKGADALYSQAIALNGASIDAYVQRGIVRRELGDTAGRDKDAQAIITLATQALAAQPNTPKLYYQRGTGWRLLKRFPEAKADITRALQLGGKRSWQQDLQAIALEEKMGK